MKEIEIPIRFPIHVVAIKGKNPKAPISCAKVVLKMNTKLPLFISYLWLAFNIFILAIRQLIGKE